MNQNAIGISDAWHGNASDAAYDYFTDFSNDLEKYADVLAELRDQYVKVSQGVWEFAQASKSLIKSIMDTAEWLGITAAAGTATSETGAGPLLAAGVGAVECWYISHCWREITNKITITQRLVDAVSGAIDKTVGDAGTFHTPPLPKGSYTHPGVH